MMITNRTLPRRTVLRGLGASLALPLLDSMVPAFAAGRSTAARPVRRFGAVYVPNGVEMRAWTPPGPADAISTPLELTSVLEPLAPVRDQVNILTGLADKVAIPREGEGVGDHARAASTWLTGVHVKKTEGADIRAGVSVDQIAARALGQETQLASLELAIDSVEVLGACDQGYSCAYANTVAWRTPTTPLPMGEQPRARCSNGSSAPPTARTSRRGWPGCARIAASSTSSPKKPAASRAPSVRATGSS